MINVARLGEVFEAGSEVSPEALHARGMVPKAMPVKVLGNGELGHALTVRANAVSATARQKIEQAGGSVELL